MGKTPRHGTNPDNMALFKITVLCALLQAAAAQVCTGDRRYGNQTLPGYDGKTVAIGSTPYGTYSASDIPRSVHLHGSGLQRQPGLHAVRQGLHGQVREP